MMEVLIFTIDTHRYSVRKDQVGSVEKVGAVHRLPFLRSSVTVLAVIGDHTRTLADIAPCLGHKPDAGNSGAAALVMSDEGQLRGFLLGSEPAELALEPEAVIPLPDYLRIPFLEGFLIQDEELLPVIEVRALFEHVARQGNPSMTSAPALAAALETAAGSAATLKLISAGGSLLALRAPELLASGGHRISRFPLLPSDIDGVTLHEKQVLPVVDIARRICGHPVSGNPLFYRARVGGESFGLLVDDGGEEWGPAETEVKDLPFICQTPWSTKAALHGGQAAAIVDLAALLSNSADVSDAEALSTRYRPESSFPSVFGRQDVEVMELLVKGRRLAIPKVEIIDVIPCAPTYAVPRAQGIVAAVANVAGELLPVIDLARIMGASSSPAAGWSMIVLSNGTFRALILSESAPETRLLKPSVQRDVPVHLPYPVVYGCYTEGEGIRLILNVHALALHFDESRAAEILPPLSPAEITREVQTQRPEEAEPETPTAAPPAETNPPPAAEAVRQDAITAEPALDEPLFQEVSLPASEEQTPIAGPEAAEKASPPDPAPAVAAAPAAEPEPAPAAEEEELFVEEVHVRRQVVVEQPAHRGRRMLAGFAASVLLILGSILGFYFSGLVHEPTAAREALAQPATASAPAPSQQAAAPAAPAQLAPAAAPQQTPAPAAPPQQASAPAAAPQPANAAAMYTVKVGDTLWDIAQRFTGDPLNYHNIAGQNLIKNPDLIFPGQTLQVEATQKQ